MNKKFLQVFNSDQTVFSVNDLSKYISHKTDNYLRGRISFYVKKGVFKKVARGFYSLRKDYNTFELANKIYSPSYISFFSALYYHKIIFQFQNNVYLAYRKTDQKILQAYTIVLKNLKQDLLLNLEWIEIKKYYSIASKERAFLDTLYIYGETYFDNIDVIDQKKVQQLLKIYNSRKLEKLVKTYF